MPTIPTWLIGKFLTGMTIIGQDVADDGTLSNNTSYILVGLLDEITLTATNDTENIVPLDVRQNFEVIVGSGQAFTLMEILNQQTGVAAPQGNCLQQATYTNDICLFTFTRGTLSFSCYGTVGDYSESIRRGKSVGTANFKPAGIPVVYGA